MGQLRERIRHTDFVGSSKAMPEVFAPLGKVAPTRTTVLLLGESGVGKELLANAIHAGGPNPDGPMVKFNCAALPESILESELFGHEKGSFTGATGLRRGRFEEADGGTLFLDEVGELSLARQRLGTRKRHPPGRHPHRGRRHPRLQPAAVPANATAARRASWPSSKPWNTSCLWKPYACIAATPPRLPGHGGLRRGAPSRKAAIRSGADQSLAGREIQPDPGQAQDTARCPRRNHKAIGYALKQWERLVVYLEDGRLRPDNNLAENALRPFAVGRKN